MKIVNVTWLDSHGKTGWVDKSVAEGWANDADCICHTFGLLIAESRRWVLVAHSEGADMYCDVIKIPRFAVKAIETLGEYEPGK